MRIIGLILLLLAVSTSSAHAQSTVTDLFKGRGAGTKKNITIIGDGFNAAQQPAYNAYVQQQIMDRLFKSSPYLETMNAFNIRRVNSTAAGAGGVSRVTETGSVAPGVARAPDLPSNGTRTSFVWNTNKLPTSMLQPLLGGINIVDPAGTIITDISAGVLSGSNAAGVTVVTGTVAMATGVVTLNYTGPAPPAGNFNFRFANLTTTVATPFGYRYSSTISRCWMEPDPSFASIPNAVKAIVPETDAIIVVLNVGTMGIGGGAVRAQGGCARDGHFAVTLANDANNDGDSSEDWTVLAHESGHLFAGLCDEYINGVGAPYALDTNMDLIPDEFPCANMSATANRATIKWGQFIDPVTVLPTVFGAGMTNSGTVGAFVGGGGIAGPGGQGFTANAWRPTNLDRMNQSGQPYSPVSYDSLRQTLNPGHDHNFQKSYIGDFNNDGLDDVVVHSPGALELYLSNGTHLVQTSVMNGGATLWDRFLDNDQFVVGDFDNDGMDDLYVFNATDWDQPYFAMLRSTGNGFAGVRRFAANLPGWQMTAGDQFFVGDFDGDRRVDLAVFNYGNWIFGYFAVFRSSGTDLSLVQRFDDNLPGWEMRAADKYVVGDFNGDMRSDIAVLNGTNWGIGYLGVLVSTGAGLAMTARHDGSIQGWDQILRNDQIYVANFDGDPDQDLFIFNGLDWVMPYLAQLEANAGTLTRRRRFDGNIPGWQMARNDRFVVADTRNDGLDDLYVFNGSDWFSPYLGTLVTQADGNLAGSWQVTNITCAVPPTVPPAPPPPQCRWTFANTNKLQAGRFSFGGWQDVLISDSAVVDNEQIAILVSNGGAVSQNVMYPKWIVDHPFNSNGWW